MSIGTGIALIVIGAILAFAINVDLGGAINLDLIGYLLMAAGFVVFVIGMVLMMRKRSTSTTVRQGVDPASGQSVSHRETRSTPDEPIV
jgi:uncharacterized membrane protein